MRTEIKYSEAIREALDYCLGQNENVFIVGEGVPDPKGIFNTTMGLQEKYGSSRVMDMPLSENAMTGVCIGSSIVGMRPILIHQRADFSYLSLDQIINNASKWHYMFNGQVRVPLVIRMIIGRGWGQGPQHSSSPQALFSHFPGLKVVMPARPHDAKGMLIQAVQDDDPVIFFEHRWLHHIKELVPEEGYTESLGDARVLRRGDALTLVAFSYMVIEAIKISDVFKKYGVNIEVIDMRSTLPLDHETVLKSVNKTGRLVILDTSWVTCGISAELSARVCEGAFTKLQKPPERIALPDIPAPTTPALANNFYPTPETIGQQLLKYFPQEKEKLYSAINELKSSSPLDVPYLDFTGPF
tara:strand:- start:943 stop:2010 length:1068 start_codon:yes stop_codon:yes gene_type:complete